jgi:pimeloyl-ACP methyl ester carboxylesterase
VSTPRIRQVKLDDMTIEWEEHGSGSRPLVLVHGFTGSRDDFADVVPDLVDLGPITLVDQRGHGGSSNPGSGYDYAQLVSDLCCVFDAAGIARADLLGHSLGGMVALRFALAHPERVASLILMDTSADAVPGFSGALARMLESVRQHGMRRVVAGVETMALAGEDRDIALIEGDERFRDRLRAKLEVLDPAAFLTLAPMLSEQPSIAHQLGAISCPTTVIVGEHDATFLAPADALARGIAGAELVRIAGAGHSPQKSGRAAWVAAVRAHLLHARTA